MQVLGNVKPKLGGSVSMTSFSVDFRPGSIWTISKHLDKAACAGTYKLTGITRKDAAGLSRLSK